MKTIKKLLIIGTFLLMGKTLSAQCSADASVTNLGNGLYSITNESTTNSSNSDAQIYLISGTGQNWNWLASDYFLSSETKTLQTTSNQVADFYSVVIYDTNYICDSVVYDMSGNVVWSFQNCMLDVTVTETTNGQVLITNNSTSNGAPMGISIVFNGTNSWNSIPGNQTLTYSLLNNGSYIYTVYPNENVACSNYSSSITISTGNSPSCIALFSTTASPTNQFSFSPYANSSNTGYSYSWNLGNGTTINNQTNSTVTQTYLPGSYSVCLTVTNQQTGCSATYCDSISIAPTISNNCNANFSFFTTSTNSFQFNAQNLNSNLVYNWSFGDGTIGTGTSVNHTYSSNGTYQICLTVTDTINGTCSDVECSNVVVNSIPANPCNANFYWYDSSAFMIQFYPEFYSSAASYSWDFGDGASSSNAYSLHTYNQPGDYVVCLTISNPSAGCTETYCDTITVGPQNPISCDANFYLFQDSLNTTAIYAWNLSTGSNLSYYWSFGDGVTSSEQFPTHVYDEVGIYDLCLTVYNSDCSDSICQPIEILVKAQGVTLYVISQDSELSTNEMELDLNLNVFPNPATSHTLITWTSSTVNEYEIQLIDLNGKVLNATKINSIAGKNDYSIDLSSYEKGMYFIHIQNESTGKEEMRRIVKN